MKFSDSFYASIPSFAIALPLSTWIPDIQFLQGIEKLGIVGILAAGIMFFLMERRSFIARSGRRLEILEKQFNTLEAKVTTGNDKVIYLLSQQLDALKEIKSRQEENFSRMWGITLRSLGGEKRGQSEIRTRHSDRPVDVLRQGEDQKED